MHQKRQKKKIKFGQRRPWFSLKTLKTDDINVSNMGLNSNSSRALSQEQSPQSPRISCNPHCTFMAMKFSRDNSREIKGSAPMQIKPSNAKQKPDSIPVPDLTDFMNDMFFGGVKTEKKTYNLTGNDEIDEEEDASFERSNRSSSSRNMTEDWLEEARRIVASSPSRCDSLSRRVGSPRFAAAQERLPSALLDRRDPLSRSARRHRAVDSFSGEILLKSEKHRRNKSESFSSVTTTPKEDQPSPAAAVQKWFSNFLKPQDPTPLSSQPQPPMSNPPPPTLPPRQSIHRKSRFQTDPSSGIFKNPAALPDTHLLSPPKNLVESVSRRSISSSTCSVENIRPKSANGTLKEEEKSPDCSLNGFLREQRSRISKIINGEVDSKAKIILSGPSNSTSSMVAAVCYAWLMENRMRSNNNRERDEDEFVVVPVINAKRERMWKHRQAAWLFDHVGLDATSLLFTDEVNLESLMIDGRLSILVVGQDVLRSNGENGSQCTILTDNYCEYAYDLLQTMALKKLLLSGILLDTKNLDSSAQLSMTRDAEAVQLLLVGSNPNYRNTLYDQLMQDRRESSFLEVLQQRYGKPPKEGGHESPMLRVYDISTSAVSLHEDIVQNAEKKSKSDKPTALPQAPAATSVQGAKGGTADSSRGKNKFFLAKWFGFGSK